MKRVPSSPRRARNTGPEALEEVREIVKNSGAQVGVKTKAAEGVSGVLRKNISAQQVAGDGETADADEKREGPAPAAQDQMAQPRNRPGQARDAEAGKAERGPARAGARLGSHLLGDRRHDNFGCGSFVQMGLGQQRNNFILNRAG